MYRPVERFPVRVPDPIVGTPRPRRERDFGWTGIAAALATGILLGLLLGGLNPL